MLGKRNEVGEEGEEGIYRLDCCFRKQQNSTAADRVEVAATGYYQQTA